MPTQPAPIIVEPNGEFLGNDGSWSMFEIQVGMPGQKIQVLPSTMLSQTLVVMPSGCSTASGDPSNCTQARGGAYDSTKSSHWTSKNIFPLNLEVNLGLIHNSDNGAYGYDELSIATENGGNVTLNQQLLSGVATKDFFLGSLGLSSTPITFDDPPDVRQSLLTSLKNASLIPSLSYGYTAGASYRNRTGSLTLGGYDTSRFVPNDVSIELADNLMRQQVVALKSITYSDSDTHDGPLLTDGILTLIDTTVPHIWLPLNACRAFEAAFGISYEPISNLYLVNNDTHDALVKQNASITFEIGSSIGASPSVNITFPYASFDLEVGYPLVTKDKAPSKYFPLRRAADSTQYTLGRTFVQESYLIVDYGSKNFSISQAVVSPPPAQIVPISLSNVTETTSSTPSATSAGGPAIVATPNHKSGFPVGAIAGIVVAVIVIVLAVGGFLLRKKIAGYFRRKKQAKKERKEKGDRKELAADPPPPRGLQEIDAVDAETGREKMGPVEAAYPVGMESPPLEMGGGFEGYYHPKVDHGDRKELASPEPLPRSELSSPEPISRQQSPNLMPTQHSELSTPDPQCAEMASPFDSVRSSPHYDPSSALSSPRWPRPPLGSRRSGLDRVSTTTTSNESGFNMPIQRNGSQHSAFSKDGTPLRLAHLRRDSDDSGFTQETLTGRTPRPRSLRQDSTESGFTADTLTRRPSQHQRINSDDSNVSNVSDPLLSPGPLPHPSFHPARDSATMDPHPEEELDQDSDSPLVGTSEPQTAQVARRGSGNLITQMSPPASPGKSSIPRKEVAAPSSAHGHRRQESSVGGGPPSAFQSPQVGSQGFHSHSRMRSSSSASGSKFEEHLTDEVKK